MHTTTLLIKREDNFLTMNVATPEPQVKSNPFQLDYTHPANDPVLMRALWQIKDFGLSDVIETVTRHEGVINSTAWSWTVKLKNGKYHSIAAIVEYDPLKGWNYEVRHSPAETPAKCRVQKKQKED